MAPARQAAKHVHSNGIVLDQLQGIVDAVRSHPEAGKVTIRTRHRWDDAFAVDGHAIEIEHGAEVETRTHSFRTDWPRDVGGNDSGPTPGETVLAALGACVAMTYIIKAATQGVDIDELEVTLEAQVDFRGTFELDSVRPGLGGVTVTVGVRSDADDAALDELGQASSRTSPVYDTLANPVPLQLSVQRLPYGQAIFPDT
jgi:uncharacterized OsmC-like protein